LKPSKLSHTPFQCLKKALENKQFAFRKRERIEVRSDEEIFRDAMADVREIKEFREISPEKPPKIDLFPLPKDDSLDVLQRIVKGEKKIRLSDTAEYIEWSRPEIRKDIARRLHHGAFSVQDYIDLHGMTLIEAEEALDSFFKESVRRRLFCVKIIHGRGLRSPKGPVLKEALKKLLHGSFRKWIIAYSTARRCDGGLGATYIILKSK
jgi:DNA-nicking Smr family endonuclease